MDGAECGERERETRELFSARHFLARAKRGEKRQSFNLHHGAMRETRTSQRAAERKFVISQILFSSYLVIRFNIIDKVEFSNSLLET
ncbi:hypothetical protein E2320_020555 [Naja naja]|nr:hypothetical protein E2320_020555 [Naja naja]